MLSTTPSFCTPALAGALADTVVAGVAGLSLPALSAALTLTKELSLTLSAGKVALPSTTCTSPLAGSGFQVLVAPSYFKVAVLLAPCSGVYEMVTVSPSCGSFGKSAVTLPSLLATGVGAVGLVVFIVITAGFTTPTLPAGSLTLTLMVFAPSLSSLVGVALHSPFSSTFTSTTSGAPPFWAGKVAITVSPLLPVPLIVGVVSLVMLSPLTPVSESGSRVAVVPVGAVVSTVTFTTGKSVLVPVVLSVTSTPIWFSPSLSALVGTTSHVPPLPTVTVFSSGVPSFEGKVTLIVSPSLPLPVIFGMVLLVIPSPLSPESELGSRVAVAVGLVVFIVITAGFTTPTLPAGSLTLTLMVFAPSLSSLVGVALHSPFSSTFTSTTSGAPPFWAGKVAITVSPLLPVPLIVGVVSLVMLSPLTPVSESGSRVAVVPVGAVVSTVTFTTGKSVLVPVVLSVTSTPIWFSPSLSALVGTTSHVPPLPTVTVFSSGVPSFEGKVTLIVSPSLPLPVIFGMVLLVIPSPLSPESELGSRVAVAVGLVVFIVITAGFTTPTLPAGSLTLTLMVFAPSLSSLVGVALHSPFSSTFTSTTSGAPPFWAGKVAITVSPLLPVPLIVGVVSLVMLSPLTPVSESGSRVAVVPVGAVVSTVTFTTGKSVLVPVVLSVTSTPIWFSPSLSALVGTTSHVPPLPTVTVFSSGVPSFEGKVTLIVSPSLPLPVIFGMVLLVIPSPLSPESELGSRVAVAVGLVVFIVITAGFTTPTLPAGSLTLTLMVFAPSLSSLVGVALHSPFSSTFTSTTSGAPPFWAGKVAITVSPLLPVPLIVGVVSLVMLSPLTPVSESGSRVAVVPVGAVVSTVTTTGSLGSLT
ncbi:Uncharacterised protein [Moraxella caprae]|uniref:Uncharacterized protein n=1 Tax=Moraxella caprae TaxID=90240 RepID=A0A378U7D2_9GAMM|nr:Uncharacterised protein [Moraxella caprae]